MSTNEILLECQAWRERAEKAEKERDQYKTGLETVKTHLETITGRIVKMSGTYQIVCKYLNGGK